MRPTTSASPAATVLYEDRVIALDRIGSDSGPSSDDLWVEKRDLPRVSGFELTLEGACRADLCLPVTSRMVRGDDINLTAFVRAAGQPVVAEPAARVWSVGARPAPGGWLAVSRVAPDFTAPDRQGRPVHLADFRGKKILVVTWASW